MKKTYLLLFILAMLFSACETNDNSLSSNPDDTSFTQNFGASVSRDFIGQVVDVANNPIQNATIKIGNSTVQTDANGVFIINGATVYEKFAYITAKKIGYIDGSRSMVPTSGKNNVRIMMIGNTPQATIQSGETSEVSINSGTKVVFDGAFQDENGNDYSGSVQVALFHLTPSDENINKLMPGMLYAQTENNEEAVLETFGMMNVELRGNAGQKLNIKTGHKAEIAIRIDDNQLATAQATLPLLHFEEEKGYWKEDGMATKIGNYYVGEVSHFSWWNFGYCFPKVLLNATITDANGNPLSYFGIELESIDALYNNSYTGISFGFSGQISGLIPANQAIKLNVVLGCGVVYSANIGPFSNNTTLPTIVINNPNIFSSNIIGNLLDCNNNVVTNGYIIINKNEKQSILPVKNGSFNFNELICQNQLNFSLKGVNFDNLQEIGPIIYNFNTPTTTIGNIQTCTTISEFISYQIDNQEVKYAYPLNCGLSINNQGLSVEGSNINDNAHFLIYSNINEVGIYTGSNFSIEGDPIGYIIGESDNTVQFNLNNFGEIGEYIDMTFSGSYEYNSTTHTITGVVHVLRDN
jgi:hypothetical protein